MLPGTERTWLTCDFEVCEGTCEEVSKKIEYKNTHESHTEKIKMLFHTSFDSTLAYPLI